MPGVAFLSHHFTAESFPLEPDGVAYYRSILPGSTLSGRVRVGLPAWTGTEGYGVVTSNLSADFFFDVVVLKDVFSRSSPHQMKAAQALGQRIFVDVDDLVDDLPNWHPESTKLDPNRNKALNSTHFIDSLIQADGVITSTPYLFDRYRALRDNVAMVRNAVNPDVFTKRSPTSRKPLLGWVGNIEARPADIENLRWWLPEFVETHGLQIHHTGTTSNPWAMTFAETSGIPPSHLTESPRLPLHEYFALGFPFDIGLVPLVDEPFNHAKSALKGMEYASCGIPFVAQATPEYRWLAASGVGRVAETPADWVRHLTELLDYKTRKREAAMNFTAIQRHHTIAARADEWRAVLQG
jgi:hypothetical protein